MCPSVCLSSTTHRCQERCQCLHNIYSRPLRRLGSDTRLPHLQVAASRLQLQKQAAETQKAVRIWTDRAEAAVHADKDDLARYALRQRTNAKVTLPQFARQPAGHLQDALASRRHVPSANTLPGHLLPVSTMAV